MKKLMYQIRKMDENGNSEILLKNENESFAKKQWEKLQTEKGYDYSLECGWYMKNGKFLGALTVLENK